MIYIYTQHNMYLWTNKVSQYIYQNIDRFKNDVKLVDKYVIDGCDALF